MSMKKFLVPALALLLLVFTLTACGFAPASADTAYAAGSDLYICISPSDEELVSSEWASVSGIVVKRDPAGADVFRLIKSYYYPVTSYGDIYVLGGEFEGSGFYIKRYDDNGNKIITDDMEVRADELPAGAAQTSPLLPLTIADGKYVTLNNALPVYAGDTSFELYYLGASAAGGSNLAFLAKSDAVTDYGIADASSFLSFTVGWHPVAETRRAELLAPEDPAPEVPDGDLTGGEPSDALRIILIIGIAVPALIIVVLIFKPVRSDARGYDNRRKTVKERGTDYDRARSYEADRDRYDRGYRDYERERARDYDGRGYDGRDYDRGRDYDSNGRDGRY